MSNLTFHANVFTSPTRLLFAVSSPILPKYQHTNIMQKVAVMNNNEELSPCCAPRKMSPLSLLYTLDGDFIRKHLPNMAVESCGCT